MDFALYNTPVIDFTRWKEEAFSARKVLGIVTGDRTYGSGLKAALGQYYRLAVSGAVSYTHLDVYKRQVIS